MKPIERSPAERHATLGRTIACLPAFAHHTILSEFIEKVPNGIADKIPLHDHTNGRRFVGHNKELAIADRVTERHASAHPHPLGFACRDLVSDALGNDLALELRK
jgi:hypothetical protein